MDPREPVSKNIGPPWQPAAWSKSPDRLEDEARLQLFQDRIEIEHGVLNTGDRAMSGGSTAPQNESDQVIDGSTPGDTPSGDIAQGRYALWHNQLKALYKDEPLAAWATGAKDGPANPNA